MRTEFELITPGHGDPTDTLIAWGLSSAIVDGDPAASVKIYNFGHRYKLIIKSNIEYHELINISTEVLKENLKREYLRFKVAKEDFTIKSKLLTVLSLNKEWQKLPDKILSHIETVNDLISKFKDLDHMYKLREGRSKTKDLYTLPMVLAPFAGKYSTESFKSTGTRYAVCSYCMALSLYGLLASGSVILYRGRKESVCYYFTLLPLLAGEDDVVLVRSVLGEKSASIGVVSSKLSLHSIPLLVLAEGETLGALSGKYELMTWSVERGGRGALGLRGQLRVPATRLLKFCYDVKANGYPLMTLINTLKRSEPELIGYLSEIIMYGGDAYSVLRELKRAFSRDSRREQLLNEVLVNSLYSL